MQGDYHGDDPKASTTAIVSLIGVIGLLAAVVFAIVLFQNVQWREDERKIYATRPQALIDLHTAQLEPINEYRWVDADAGVAAIPIDRAIPLYVEQLKSGTLPATMELPGEQPATTTSPTESP